MPASFATKAPCTCSDQFHSCPARLRFNEIKDLLREKYGAKFKSLTRTAWSLDWLTGDHFYRVKEITYM